MAGSIYTPFQTGEGASPIGAPGVSDYQRIETNPDMFGGGIGKAAQGLGQTILGASKEFVQAAIQKQDLTNELHANDASTALMQTQTKIWGQYNTLEGKAAHDAWPQVQEQIQKAYQDAIAAAPNPMAKKYLSTSAKSITDYYLRSGQSYADQQWKTWFDQSATARSTELQNQATIARDNPAAFDMFLKGGIDEAIKPLQAKGLTGDELSAATRRYTGVTVAKAAETQLTEGNMQGAIALVGRYTNQMDAESRLQVQTKLKPAILAANAAATKEWAMNGGNGPKPEQLSMPKGFDEQVQKDAAATGAPSTDSPTAGKFKTSLVIENRAVMTGVDPKAKSMLDGMVQDGAVGEIKVRSGHRDEEANAVAGGVQGSQHIEGKAFDLDISGKTDDEKAAILASAIAHGARGIGIYPSGNSLHIDVRNNPTVWGFAQDPHHALSPAETLAKAPAWARVALGQLYGATGTIPAPPGAVNVGLTRAPIPAGAEGTAALIKHFEGYKSTPYFDTNAYRVGYGSDTVTLPNGQVTHVRQGMKINQEDADRDLNRRIGEFQHTVIGQVGPQSWGKLSGGTQAALTSVAYNYGSLPANVVTAVATGNTERIAQAVESLGANHSRRAEEAAIIRGGGMPTGFGTAPTVAGADQPSPYAPITRPADLSPSDPGGALSPFPDEAKAIQLGVDAANGDPAQERANVAAIRQEMSTIKGETADQRAAIQAAFPDLMKAAGAGVMGVELPPNLEHVFPPEKAREMRSEFDETKRLGTVLRGVQFASPDDLNKAYQDIAAGHGVYSTLMSIGHNKMAGGPGAAQSNPDAGLGEGGYFRLQQTALGRLESLVKNRQAALAADPAVYMASEPSVAAALKGIDPKDPQTFANYATATLAQQDRMGVPEAQQHVMSRDQATQMTQQLMTAGDPKATMDQLEHQHGAAWPHVFRDMVTLGKLPTGYQAISVLDPVNSKLLARALAPIDKADSAQKVDWNQRLGDDAAGKPLFNAIKLAVGNDPAVTSLRRSMQVQGISDGTVDSMVRDVETLAAARNYYAPYEDPATASANAVKAFTGQYSFMPIESGGARVPADKMPAVATDIANVIEGLTPDKIQVPEQFGHKDPFGRDMGASKQEYIDFLKSSPTWVNNPHADGLVLLDHGLQVVKDQDGKPIQVLFANAGQVPAQAQPKRGWGPTPPSAKSGWGNAPAPPPAPAAVAAPEPPPGSHVINGKIMVPNAAHNGWTEWAGGQ